MAIITGKESSIKLLLPGTDKVMMSMGVVKENVTKK